jgi:ABC-type antimicrobial peptide transport system permease subunit
MIVRQGIGLVSIGIIVGAPFAFAGGQLLEPLLFETAGRDTLIAATVAVVLLGVAVLASLVPAILAARTDPLIALRTG